MGMCEPTEPEGPLPRHSGHPAQQSLPGKVVLGFHSLGEGGRVYVTSGESLRMREKDARAIQESRMSASSGGKDFICQEKALKGKHR